MEKYKIVSLFSGAGGLDLGFILTKRFKIVLANDILESATETYSFNFKVKKVVHPDFTVEDLPAIVLGDVAQLDFNPLKDMEIDVVIGGPPCQDFSIIRGPQNKRRGIEVKRGKLYIHFVRALMQLQPKMFVFENVPGLTTSNNGLAYKTILEDLAMWYEILFSGIVDMTKLGLPQKRKRLIIIGLRKDLAKNLKASALRSKLQEIKTYIERELKGTTSIFAKYPVVPLEVFEGNTLPNLQEAYREVMKEYEGVWKEVNTQRAWKWKRRIWDKLSFDVIKDYIFLNKIENCTSAELEEAFDRHREILKEMGYLDKNVKYLKLPDGSNEIPRESEKVIERMRRIPPGENHLFVKGTKWEVKGLLSNIYRRIHPLIPSPTILAYGGGGTWGYHYERSRSMLTNREKARLQSFPDTFLFWGTWSQVRAQIGEAVPPLVAKRIAEIIARVLDMV